MKVRCSFLAVLMMSALAFGACVPRIGPVEVPMQSFIFIVGNAACSGVECTAVFGRQYSGTGFALKSTEDGTYVMTAGHICESGGDGPPELQAVTSKADSFLAQIMTIDIKQDMCILFVPGMQVPPLKVSRTAPAVGDTIFTMGFPAGIWSPGMIPILTGHYSGPVESNSTDGYTVPSHPGSSGSPILNKSGEGVGMVIMSHSLFPHFTLSPSYWDIMSFIDMLLSRTSDVSLEVERPNLIAL